MTNELMRAESKGNMQDFEKARKDFTWAQVEKEFDWSSGGVYNVAHEIIDRHQIRDQCRGHRSRRALSMRGSLIFPIPQNGASLTESLTIPASAS